MLCRPLLLYTLLRRCLNMSRVFEIGSGIFWFKAIVSYSRLGARKKRFQRYICIAALWLCAPIAHCLASGFSCACIGSSIWRKVCWIIMPALRKFQDVQSYKLLHFACAVHSKVRMASTDRMAFAYGSLGASSRIGGNSG
jgi:hypothetical protein